MPELKPNPADLTAIAQPVSLAGLRGQLQFDEPMASHVSWRAGGKVKYAYTPADLDDLAAFVGRLRPDEPLMCVGLGSNLLVRDGGYDGTVILCHGAMKVMRVEPDGSIYIEAGVASPKVARYAASNGRSGMEFLAGIPGTLGGALAMNAGCHGGETWQFVERVLMLNRRGELHVRQPDEFSVGYRHVGLKASCDELFAAAWLRLPVGEEASSRQRIAELLEKRSASQPLDLPNAGSVFRNPPGDHAARLIEQAGLKGLSCGGAKVSEKHANFIVNPEGMATATEIERLIQQIQAIVREKFGVDLKREVRIVGVAA